MPELFAAVEKLSKSRLIRDGKFEEAILEILSQASRALNIQRVNAWVFEKNHTEIRNICNYDQKVVDIPLAGTLTKTGIPKYFKLLTSREIIVTDDAFRSKQTAELLDIYLAPLNVRALMDVPISIAGELVGVVCFENTGKIKKWTDREQKFGMIIAQMISLAIETNEKQAIKAALEKALKEQKMLLQEVNHRVKNNLSIISSLINWQAERVQDEYHRGLFLEMRSRILSIAAVHEMIYQSKSYSEVNFKTYVKKIIENILDSIADKSKEIKLELKVENITLPISTAIPLALIINEIITNSIKHAFKQMKSGIVSLNMKETKNNIELVVSDNGSGFDPKSKKNSALGIEIIDTLLDQINAESERVSNTGTQYTIKFKR